MNIQDDGACRHNVETCTQLMYYRPICIIIIVPKSSLVALNDDGNAKPLTACGLVCSKYMVIKITLNTKHTKETY